MPTPLPISDRPVRLAVVGLGQIAELVLPTYLERDDVVIVGLCDRDEAQLAVWRARCPDATATTSLDELLTRYSQDWSLTRMPAMDRNALRLALFEMRHTDVPDEVAIDEAVDLVTELSTDESPAFVNGVLGAILRDGSHRVAPDA